MKSEKEKMLAGEWFDPRNEELTADRDRATLLMHRLNAECPGHDAAYRAALRVSLSQCSRIHPRALLLRLRLQHPYRRRLFRQFRLRLPRSGSDPYRAQYADRAQGTVCSPRTTRWTPTCARQAAKPASPSPSATTAGWAAASSSVRASGSATAR
ncbi:MAG: maltose acetyltransferase domain-containing protein [Alistipes finegoldii]